MSRRVLVLAHTGREESLKAAWEACALLRSHIENAGKALVAFISARRGE